MSNESVLVLSNFFAILALSPRRFGRSPDLPPGQGPEAAALLGNNAIWLACAVAPVATVGSLIYSEVIHFVPCRLCWFQRIAMYPLSLILLVGAIRREAVVKYYALPLALIGLAVSIYHNLVQFFPSMEGDSCDPLNPCSARSIAVFGFMDLPVYGRRRVYRYLRLARLLHESRRMTRRPKKPPPGANPPRNRSLLWWSIGGLVGLGLIVCSGMVHRQRGRGRPEHRFRVTHRRG